MAHQAHHAASVVIATHNRRDSTRRAVASAMRQRPRIEVIVVDDASTDGTAEMISAEFPGVRLVRLDRPLGAAAARSRGVAEASAPIVVSIDDDAYFTDSRTVARTVADFDRPVIGAVAVPLLENGKLLQGAPAGEGAYVTDFFIGAAHAVRRDLFLRLGGFRASLMIYVEEPDLCLRMLAAGFVTRAGTAPPVAHDPHPARNVHARVARRLRNEMLFKWCHTPGTYLPMVLAGHVASTVRQSARMKSLLALRQGLIGGLGGILAGSAERRPVGMPVYRLWRRLRREGRLPLESIEGSLPRAVFAPMMGLEMKGLKIAPVQESDEAVGVA